MLFSSRAIVVKTFKYSENSIIAKLFTEQLGMQSYLINGVRSAKSKSKAALFQPLTLLSITAYQKETRNLQRIKEIKADRPFQSVPFNIVKTSIAFFLSEILYKTIKDEGNPDRELFGYLHKSFCFLDKDNDHLANFHLLFLLKLTRYFGFYPLQHAGDNSYFDMEEGAFVKEKPPHENYFNKNQSLLLQQFLKMEFEDEFPVKIKRVERKEILEKLITYYKVHISGLKELNAQHVLEKIFSE